MRTRALLAALAASAVLTPAPAIAQGDTRVTVGNRERRSRRTSRTSRPSRSTRDLQSLAAAGQRQHRPRGLQRRRSDDLPLHARRRRVGHCLLVRPGGSWHPADLHAVGRRPGLPGTGRPAPGRRGPIGTLPKYYENGLVSNGDPALAFGPRPDADGRFSWANGSRLYYANIATNFAKTARGAGVQGLRGDRRLAHRRCAAAAAGGAAGKAAWNGPVIVSKPERGHFSDKEQVRADNAASSPYFGNAYICNVAFRSNGKGAARAGPLRPLQRRRATAGPSAGHRGDQ